MKISIDIRNASLGQIHFCEQWIGGLLKEYSKHTYQIYSSHFLEDIPYTPSASYKSFFGEQILFLKKLGEDKSDLVISLGDSFPIFYRKNVIQIIPSLEKLLYPNVESAKTLSKHLYQNTLKTNLKYAHKIVCFDEKTKKDINEKLNIDESKIEVISGFFALSKETKAEIELPIDIKQKYSLNEEYFIYDSGTGTNKNIKRLLESIAKTPYYLIFLGSAIANDLEIRELILRSGVKDKIIFAGTPEEKELKYYYQQSAGVIFPHLYSSFPFSLENALSYQTPILASHLDELQNIFAKQVTYFSPLSVLEMRQAIELYGKQKKEKKDYSDIIQKYSKENFIHNLGKVCQI